MSAATTQTRHIVYSFMALAASACSSPTTPTVATIQTPDHGQVAQPPSPTTTTPVTTQGGVRFNVIGPTECITHPSGIYQWAVEIDDAGPSRLHFVKPMAFHSDTPGCHEVHDRPKEWFHLHGQTDYAAHAGGTAQLRYDSREVACGSVQLDESALNDAGGTEIIVGHMIDYGVMCPPTAPPAVPQPPVPPVAPAPPSSTPTCQLGAAAIILAYPQRSTLNIVSDGNTATATFWIAAGCVNVPVSLVSYQKVTHGVFLPQRFVAGDFVTRDAGGPYTLAVRTSSCDPQSDLRWGGYVEGQELNAETEANDYGPRTLDWNYSNEACR